ncbi:MAG: hypothetical protein KF802_06260 [Bdellovibrionaceae bacterium]|nr:hypothetical protein [Pseudobdellovibrionaceae bacterium]MBX3032525.1 hypothetical protein [Pseudobdellovibrionaceae bacterium]
MSQRTISRQAGLVFFLTISLSPWVKAQDAGVSYRIHHQYVGTRPLGMGDAFVAVANDYNALLYNPAGLARREDGEMNLLIDVGISKSLPDLTKEISEAQDTQGSESDKQQAMFDLLQKQYGKTIGLRLTPFSGFLVRPNWGIAVIPADVTLEGSIHQGVGPSLNTTVYADTTVALGYGDDYKGFSNGRLSWGVTGKFINRGYFSKSINFIELASDSKLIQESDMREGFGVDADLGLLYTPNLPDAGFLSLLRLTRPSFGLVVRNVAETKFTTSSKLLNKEKTEPPEKLHRVVDVGTRWEYPSMWLFGGRGVMDFRDLMHPSISLRKSLHLGLEFDWTVASWWKGSYRVGLNQGYLTAGISALLGVFNLDAVTYGEDVGTYSTPAENRMYAIRMNINW